MNILSNLLIRRLARLRRDVSQRVPVGGAGAIRAGPRGHAVAFVFYSTGPRDFSAGCYLADMSAGPREIY